MVSIHSSYMFALFAFYIFYSFTTTKDLQSSLLIRFSFQITIFSKCYFCAWEVLTSTNQFADKIVFDHQCKQETALKWLHFFTDRSRYIKLRPP